MYKGCFVVQKEIYQRNIQGHLKNLDAILFFLFIFSIPYSNKIEDIPLYKMHLKKLNFLFRGKKSKLITLFNLKIEIYRVTGKYWHAEKALFKKIYMLFGDFFYSNKIKYNK